MSKNSSLTCRPAAELVDLEQRLRRRVRALVDQVAGAPSGSPWTRRSSAPRASPASRGTPSPCRGPWTPWSPRPGSGSGSSRRGRRSRARCPAFCAVIASFSYASRTSPLPPAKVCSASRADLSCTARVRQHLVQEVERLLGRLALRGLRAVGGHQVPLGAAGRERVRRDHLDAVLDDVVPRLDALRVALADGEHDDRVGHEPVGRRLLAQAASTMPGSTSLSTSGASESATMSAGRPLDTARDWSPEAP